VHNLNRNNYSRKWKEKDQKYLFELQKFLDKAENIKDEGLKQSIISQMLRCDKILTELAEEIIKDMQISE